MSGEKHNTSKISQGDASYKEALLETLDKQSSLGAGEIQQGRQRLVAQICSEPVAQVPRGSVSFKPLVAIAAGVVLALGFWMYLPRDEQPIVSIATPSNTPVAFNSLWRVGTSQQLPVGTTATVPEGMGAKLQVSPKSALWVGEHTTFSLDAADGSAVRLKGGRLLVSIAKEEMTSFAIESPHGLVRVYGTVFSVSSDHTETTVRLYEGVVDLKGAGFEQTMQPGQSAVLAPGAQIEVSALAMKDAIADLLIAEPFVKNHGDFAPTVPDILALAEGLTSTDELEENKPPVQTQPPRGARRSSRVIEAKKGQIDVKRVDTDSKPPILEQISEDKEERILFEEIKTLYDARECEPVIEKCVEYIRKFPSGIYDDQVVYFRGYCQAYLGDLSGGKESLEVYFSRYRDGRYWNSIKEILKDE